ncbi:ATP-dependent helicase HrpB [Pseudonocardia sp. H11422]|uniref:ATP-dependent helicase HrpB n=1 Tax=Pseudonocardia sp. H11422 TaxID=2835866 RepID=UPI001BDDACFC|nr:ATP-dependent helicase HrpB [Pseudonocardia sp. H11422]
MRRPADLPDLPVRAVLDQVTGILDEHGAAVLVAPPGTGKTTLVPLAMAASGAGRVLVAEPRRVAARAAAARMAALLGERVGGRVGYSVRGDSRVCPGTRIEVVTSGLLLRRLAHDPELSGVDAVLLDECHERHLDADLLLALLLDARDGLRPDLRLLATSATVATDRLGSLLGDAPVLSVAARTFPVHIRHVPPVRNERIEACVARAVRTALADGDGDVLAFLPGVAEIRRTSDALAGLSDVDVVALHGRMPTAEQDAALTEGPRRRVVLSTALAESSLTVPGVRAVVDAGLARVPRVDHRRGLAGLVTVRVSAAVAEQRAGRAGRQAPGRAYRCWPEAETAALPRFPEPEIRTADLTRLALDLACWGTPDGGGLRWWDAPPEGPLRAGQEVLRALGALDDSGVTDRGRRMADLGLHPRLARALLDGTAQVGARTAAEVVAVLDDDTLAAGVELGAELGRLRGGAAPGAGRWRREVGRLTRLVGSRDGGPEADRRDPDRRGRQADRPTGREGDPPADRADAAALVVALAHPERLARRRAGGSSIYLMAGGTAVELPPGSPLAEREWLAVAVADRRPGDVHARVRLAAPADRETAERGAPALLADSEEVAWRSGDVAARRVRRLGAIVLEEQPLPDPPADRVRAALVEGLRAEGTGLLRWTPAARSLRDRLALLHRALGSPWPAVDEDVLIEGAAHPDGWLAGPLATARNRADLARIDAGAALRVLAGWQLASSVDELAPERLEVPSGSRIALDYSGERPVLPVRVQEVFGWTRTPTIAAGRLPVVLHLLSPAGRPAAVTGDLESFWTTGYPQVRSELRGRYPKHDWPADPLTAVPSRRPGRG